MQISDYFARVSRALDATPQAPIQEIIRHLQNARAARRQIFLCGNGGSAATVSHIAADLVKSTVRPDEPRLRVISLGENLAALTAYSNDVSYDVVFAEPLRSLGEPGDILVAVSGSGNSRNVLAAADAAREIGMTCLGLTGFQGGALASRCDVCVIVPADSMQVIEDAHLSILHAIFLALCE
jgi:D-sedoheptulose 7-phosphate isomerase